MRGNPAPDPALFVLSPTPPHIIVSGVFCVEKKLSYLFSLRQLLLLLLIFAFAAYGLWNYFSDRTETVSAAEEGVPLPVLMYHGVLEDESRSGKYIISTQTLREDLAYLYARGYSSVTVADLIAYVSGKGDLPEKPVMITFDDGFLNNAVLAVPVLEEFSYRAVFSVVGAYADQFSAGDDHNVRYAYLTWDDIRALNQSGVVEIQNHTYDMHSLSRRKGCARMDGESPYEYKSALRQDLQTLQDKLAEYCGVTATAFTPPYGIESGDTLDVIREMGFSAVLTCSEQVNLLTRDPECLYHIGRFNRPAGISTSQFMKKLGIE